MTGQSGTGVASSALKFAKDNKLLSRGLKMIPHPAAQGLGYLVGQAGYGKPKRKHRKRRSKQVGAGLFSDIGGGIGNVFGGLGAGVGSVARGLFGGAKRRRRVTAIRT